MLVPATPRNHHELELAIGDGQAPAAPSQAEAMDYVAGYALCLDTDRQGRARRVQEEGAAMDSSQEFRPPAQSSAFVPKEKIRDPHNLSSGSRSTANSGRRVRHPP